jgi:uracil-DNA glycosylase family 4
MSKSYDQLHGEIARCRICADRPDGKPLPHEPRPVVWASAQSRILIAGQAPGTRVHRSGKPFTDPSGVRLRDWMDVDEATFYDRSNIAVIPMGFCFPGLDAKGGDLPPRRECAPAWRDRLMAQLSRLQLVMVIGQYAQAWHLGKQRGRTLTETVAQWRDYRNLSDQFEIIPLPHPSWRNNAWIKMNPWFEAELVPHLRRKVKSALK